MLAPLGHKVLGVVNYDHFYLDPALEDAWAAFVQRVVGRYYERVTRYATTSFLRAKLGPALVARGLVPHIYDTAEEAREGVRRPERVDRQGCAPRDAQWWPVGAAAPAFRLRSPRLCPADQRGRSGSAATDAGAAAATRALAKMSQHAMNIAAITGPMTKPLMPKIAMPPRVDISTT